jgi:hypothetical protein
MAKFSLPGSSFEELRKIVHAYANAKKDASLSDVAGLAGVHSTVVSRNNKFLSEVLIVEGGQRKTATSLGRKLGRAIEHGVESDEFLAWAEAIQSNEPLSNILTTVRIKGGMSEQDLTKHILYISEQSNSSNNRTGARCILDVLKRAALLTERDGSFSVATSTKETILLSEAPGVPERTTENKSDNGQFDRSVDDANNLKTSDISPCSAPSINVNIQIHVPEGQDADTYDKIFAAIKKNLFPSSRDD